MKFTSKQSRMISCETRSGYAVALICELARVRREYLREGEMPSNIHLSRTTRYRVRKELEEEGLIEKHPSGKGWKLTEDGHAMADLIE